MTKKQKAEFGIVCALLLAGAAYMDYSDGRSGRDGELARNAYGEGSREIEFVLNADSLLKNYTYNVQLDEIRVTEAEAEEYFVMAQREIDDSFHGSGQSLNHVSGQVYPRTTYAGGKVAAEWYFSNYSMIDTDGVLIEERLSGDGDIIGAEAELTCGDYKKIYAFSFCAYPRELDQAERLLKGIDNYLKEQQAQSGGSIRLPESMDGIPLSWTPKKEHLVLKVLLLEVLILVMLPLVSKSRAKEAEKKRQEALMLDYPSLVSRLNVLVGAGMTIQQAWHTISAQYIDKRKKDATPKSEAFEELVRTDREISDGESEREAYRKFGERTKNSSYQRFMRLLITNLQKGNRGLCELLEQEAEAAFAEKRLLAKRLGEEASTKLLFPMMLMLAIVMAIVIVPAIQGFTI